MGKVSRHDEAMLDRLRRIVWGTPVRKIVTGLMAVLVMPAWILNYEKFLEAQGLDRLLLGDGPYSKAISALWSTVTSPALRWAIIGAAIALVLDGLYRYRGTLKATTAGEVDMDHLYYSILNAKDELLGEQNAGFTGSVTSVIGEIKSTYTAISRAGIPVPRMAAGYEATVIGALGYFSGLLPIIRDGYLAEAKIEAPKLIAALGLIAATRPHQLPQGIEPRIQP